MWGRVRLLDCDVLVIGAPPGPVQAFIEKGEDFVVGTRLEDLVEGMNRLTGENRL